MVGFEVSRDVNCRQVNLRQHEGEEKVEVWGQRKSRASFRKLCCVGGRTDKGSRL
jgi:hypothetical protein